MSDEIRYLIGEVVAFPNAKTLRDFIPCDGRLLNIAENGYKALFSIIGTIYGGDGVTTFAVPDLRGRAPVSEGSSKGTSDYKPGEKKGTEYTVLTVDQMPSHSHNGSVSVSLNADSGPGSTGRAASTYPASTTNAYTSAANANTLMAEPAYTANIAGEGTGEPVDVRSPFLTLNYLICYNGIYPAQ